MSDRLSEPGRGREGISEHAATDSARPETQSTERKRRPEVFKISTNAPFKLLLLAAETVARWLSSPQARICRILDAHHMQPAAPKFM